MSQDPTQPAKTVTLAFVGPADQFIDGVPQGDVEVEQDRAAELISSGLYEPKKNAKAPTGAEGDQP